jgi:predicted Zn-dependent protease
LALLLGALEHKPHELAAEVYKAHPEEPAFVTTYAHSLYQQKKNTEALAVLQKLKPEILAHPRVAGYYGLCLAASGPEGKQKSLTYFEAAEKGNLLPEELQLFRRSRP